MNTYDDYGDRLRAAYDVYAHAVTGIYLGLQLAGRGGAGVAELRTQGLALIEALINSVHSIAGQYLGTLPDGPDVGDRETHLRGELQRIATKNLNDLIVRLMGLGVGMVSRARPADVLTQPAGAVGLILQRKMSRPHFTVRDSAGRVWDANKLVGTITRDFAYQTYIDTMLAREKAIGAEKVDIIYADTTRNLTLTLDQAYERRATIFHINASAKVQTHVPA